ncbi:uncharacterized protein [Hetaerina americana]
MERRYSNQPSGNHFEAMHVRGGSRASGGAASAASGNAWEMERRYSVPPSHNGSHLDGHSTGRGSGREIGGGGGGHGGNGVGNSTASEDLHAWSIYRQNLNSDFTDSALGSGEKSPLPYGNFQLRETTVKSILSHPRYGPASSRLLLSSNSGGAAEPTKASSGGVVSTPSSGVAYLKFGLPRVLPLNRNGASLPRGVVGATAGHGGFGPSLPRNLPRANRRGGGGGGSVSGVVRRGANGSSGYDSSDDDASPRVRGRARRGATGPPGNGGPINVSGERLRGARSDPDFAALNGGYPSGMAARSGSPYRPGGNAPGHRQSGHYYTRNQRHHQSPHHQPSYYGADGRTRSSSEADLLAHARAEELRVMNGGDSRGVSSSMHQLRSMHDLRSAGNRNSFYAEDENIPLERPGNRHSRASVGSKAMEAETDGGHVREDMDDDEENEKGEMDERLYGYNGQHAGYLPPNRYPHLQVRGLELSGKERPLLNGVSFEVHGGEVLAVMATVEEEGTTLLDVLAGIRKPSGGDIILDGRPMRSQLRKYVSHVPKDAPSALCGDITVRQTLRLHWLLRGGTKQPKWEKRGAKHEVGFVSVDARIDALTEDLGLDPVRDTPVSRLTSSEKRRLALATRLLSPSPPLPPGCMEGSVGGGGPLVLVLDQPTHGMDIFDAFFLVEFLRQWASTPSMLPSNYPPSGIPPNVPYSASNTAPIIILTLHPPTHEVFAMLSRVVLLSTGRLMFAGRRRDMLPYFSRIQFPCPLYKNPSDYYLDLVTLDDLSAEAMLESSQRIEQLAETFARRQPPLSDPGPPGPLFPSNHLPPGIFTQVQAIILQSSVYGAPVALARFGSRILGAFLLSIILGAIFWDLPGANQEATVANDESGLSSPPQLPIPMPIFMDRLGFYYAVIAVTLWSAVLLPAIIDAGRHRKAIQGQLRERLYSRSLYILTQMVLDLPVGVCLSLAYAAPAYAMSGLYLHADSSHTFHYYVGYMLLYLIAVRQLCIALSHAFPRWPVVAGTLSGILFIIFALGAGGLPLHPTDLGPISWLSSWLPLISPLRWVSGVAVILDSSTASMLQVTVAHCTGRKHVQFQDIIVQVQCPSIDGSSALQSLMGWWMDNNGDIIHSPWGTITPQALISIAAFWFIFVLIGALAFCACHGRYRPKPGHRYKPESNRP